MLVLLVLFREPWPGAAQWPQVQVQICAVLSQLPPASLLLTTVGQCSPGSLVLRIVAGMLRLGGGGLNQMETCGFCGVLGAWASLR